MNLYEICRAFERGDDHENDPEWRLFAAHPSTRRTSP